MLERLETIDWNKLSHAYGEAADVPGLIRGLTAADRDVRENALDCLFGNIYHQGTVYDATAPAVPFLLELVGNPAIKGRAKVLDLLAHIAAGCGFCQAHQVLEKAERRNSPEYQQALAEERACLRTVRDAVWQGWPLLLRRAKSKKKSLRRAALKVFQEILQYPRPDLPAVLAKLIDTLDRPGFPERPGVLRLVGQAVRFHADTPADLEANRDHEAYEVDLFNQSELDKREFPDWFRFTEQERAWGREAVAAVWRRWPALERCAEDRGAAVREAALFAQGMLLRYGQAAVGPEFLEPARESLAASWLRRLGATTGERMRADLVFGLAAIAPADARVRAALREVLHTTESTLAGYVAALKLVDIEGTADDRGLDRLIEVHQNSAEIYQRLHALPRWDNYLAIPRLQRLRPSVIERRLPEFLEMVRSAGTGKFHSGQVREVLDLAFAGKKLPPGAAVADLVEAQRQLLLAAADNGHFWGRCYNNSLELHRWGLPTERRDLRRFLARPGEPISRPRNDPEDARVTLENLVRNSLPFQLGMSAYDREEGDTRAPSRVIRESIETMRRVSENYRPGDRPQIRKLTVEGHACDALVELLLLCPNLHEVDLVYGEATDASMPHLARLAHLEKLDLYGNWITDAGLEPLAGLTRLRELSLGATDITDEGLKHLAGLVELRKMHLGGVSVQGPGLAHLHRLQKLEEFWIKSRHLTDAATPHLGQLRALTKLDYGGPQITGRGLDQWAGLSRLRHLGLSAGALTEETIRFLPQLPALEELDFLWKTPVTDAVVRALPALPALRLLNLYHTEVTDAALEGIERFPALCRINLSGTGVTDAVVSHLLRLKRLEWAGFVETRVNAGAVEELQRAFPEGRFGR